MRKKEGTERGKGTGMNQKSRKQRLPKFQLVAYGWLDGEYPAFKSLSTSHLDEGFVSDKKMDWSNAGSVIRLVCG